MDIFSAGFALAFSVVISLIATVHKLPPWMKAWLIRHRLITDVIVFLGITAFLTFISKSVISLIGSTLATLAVSLGLEGLVWWEKRRLENGLAPMFGKANPIVDPESNLKKDSKLRKPATIIKAIWYAFTKPLPNP